MLSYEVEERALAGLAFWRVAFRGVRAGPDECDQFAAAYAVGVVSGALAAEATSDLVGDRCESPLAGPYVDAGLTAKKRSYLGAPRSRGAADRSWTLGLRQPADRLSRGSVGGARSGAALRLARPPVQCRSMAAA